MNIRHFEIFGMVYRHGTTAAAAKVLGLTQPAVSNAIKSLEGSLGIKLFHRSKKRLHPTADATILYNQSQDLFEAIKKTRDLGRDLQVRRHVDTLTIAATISPSTTVAPRAMQRFRKSHPNVKLTLDAGSYAECLERLENGDADLAVFFTETNNPKIEIQTLCNEPMLCAIPLGNRLADLDVVTPGDLEGETFISFHPELRLRLIQDRAFAQSGVDRPDDLTVRYAHTGCQLAALGLGIALVDYLTLMNHEMYRNVVFRRFEPALEASVFVGYRAKRSLNPVAAAFVKELRQCTDSFVESSEHLLVSAPQSHTT